MEITDEDRDAKVIYLTSEIAYLEFRDSDLFREIFLELVRAKAKLIRCGKHRLKEHAWIIVFYFNENEKDFNEKMTRKNF